MPQEVNGDDSPAPSATFATTHWSVVLTAGGNDPTRVHEALENLCGTYWFPIFAFIRRSGHESPDAQDLTQSFFARLIEKNDLVGADPEKGKFRSYLLGAVKHFLADARDKAKAGKRGGGHVIISFGSQSAEERYRLEPVDSSTPETLFERQWVLTLLDKALMRLRAERESEGKLEQFEILAAFLTGQLPAVSYADAAAKLGLTESAVKSPISRLRKRYGELIREEISSTVSTPAEVNEEIRHLLAVVGRWSAGSDDRSLRCNTSGSNTPVKIV